MKDLKHITNNISSDGVATIYLYDSIGCYVDASGFLNDGINGSGFAYEMEYLQDKATRIDVRINSDGGSVVEGYAIISAIQNSKVPVYTYIDGLAASISGVIAMCGSKKFIAPFGLLMLHNPSGGNDQKILDLIKGTLVIILNTNTPLTEQQISDVMDAETFYTADETIALGLVDEKIISNKEAKQAELEAITNNKNVDTTSLQNIMLVMNKLIKPINKMILVKNQLGLDESAVEETVVESVTKLQDEIKALTESLEAEKTSKAELEAKLIAVETAKTEAKKAEIEAMVNSYLEAGKIKEDEKASMIELATINFDSVKNMLDKIGSKKSPNILNSIDVTAKSVDEKSNWTIRDYEMKDAAGLLKIKNETPEVFEKMFNDFYKK